MMIRVLVADDAEDIRFLITLSLGNDARFEIVGEARDGQEALDLAATCEHDVMLLDLAMPRMDGLEVLNHLRERGAMKPVVVFSGFSSKDMVDRAIALGARDYVHKGTDLNKVADVLEAAAVA